MLLGRNRFLNQGTALNKAQDMPMGMQRFLAKKGISSSDDLTNRVQFAPRVPFRKVR